MAPRLKVTDDEYDLLTEEERVGLKEFQAEYEAELAAEEAEIAAASAGDPEVPEVEEPPAEEEPPVEEEDEAPDEEPVEEDEPAAAASETEDEPDEAAEEDAGEGEDEEEPQPVAARASVLPAYALSKSEEDRILAIKKELKEIAVRFDEGEITASDMRDQSDALEDERELLREKRAVAAMSAKNTVDTWYTTTIPMFLGQHEEYVDGTLRHKMLDTLVRELQMKNPGNPTDPKILIAAHKRIVEEMGEAPAAKAKKKKANGNGKHRELPPSFKDIPASDQNQVVTSNKFARLDKLGGVEYERAFARLSQADRDAYLQGA